MKRTPLKNKSKKRMIEDEKRKRVVAKMREEILFCQARCVRQCTGGTEDPHEIQTRGRGGSISDSDNILLICRPCHTYITEHPEFAYINGFVIHSWEEGAAGLAEAAQKREEFHVMKI